MDEPEVPVLRRVGWGPFRIPGERKRMERLEAKIDNKIDELAAQIELDSDFAYDEDEYEEEYLEDEDLEDAEEDEQEESPEYGWVSPPPMSVKRPRRARVRVGARTGFVENMVPVDGLDLILDLASETVD
ncbi:MAG: hypothetical protein ACRDQ0_04290, partial [Pseudonocardia sp.]